METSSRAPRPIDPLLESDRAARLAALKARTARPTRTAPSTPSGPSGPSGPPSGPPLQPPGFAPGRVPPPPAPTPRAASGDARPRRRHAARGARATALGLSLASTGALATLFAFTGGQSSAGNQVAAASIVTSPSAVTPTASTPATTTPTSTVPPAEAPSTAVAAVPATVPVPTTASGAATVVDGGVFSNKWGEVQVEATFAADGSLVDVTTLQTPYRDDKSVRINERAVPRLNSEALSVQSATVDTVSGATYTSTDYRRSLQSAIDAANAAGITTLT